MFSLTLLALAGFDFSGIIVVTIGGLATIAAAVLPVLLVQNHKKNKSISETLGEKNGQGSIVEMLERQQNRQEHHGEMLTHLITGQANQDERLAKLELGQVGLFKDLWTIQKNSEESRRN